MASDVIAVAIQLLVFPVRRRFDLKKVVHLESLRTLSIH
jgi:hypothetical protein